MYCGEPVAQSPYHVSVGPVSNCRMRAYGAGLVDTVTGFPAVFTVLTNDEPGTLGTPQCDTLGTPHSDTLGTPVSNCSMRAYGARLVDAVTGFPAVFTVLTNDEPGTLGTP